MESVEEVIAKHRAEPGGNVDPATSLVVGQRLVKGGGGVVRRTVDNSVSRREELQRVHRNRRPCTLGNDGVREYAGSRVRTAWGVVILPLRYGISKSLRECVCPAGAGNCAGERARRVREVSCAV